MTIFHLLDPRASGGRGTDARVVALRPDFGRIEAATPSWHAGIATLPSLIISTLQHVAGLASSAIMSLIVANAAGTESRQTAAVFRTNFVALAIANLLQFSPLAPRPLVPASYTAVHPAPSLVAARNGGMPLVAGMTIFAGFLETALAGMTPKVKHWVGVQVLGVILVLVGTASELSGLGRHTARSRSSSRLSS